MQMPFPSELVKQVASRQTAEPSILSMRGHVSSASPGWVALDVRPQRLHHAQDMTFRQRGHFRDLVAGASSWRHKALVTVVTIIAVVGVSNRRGSGQCQTEECATWREHAGTMAFHRDIDAARMLKPVQVLSEALDLSHKTSTCI